MPGGPFYLLDQPHPLNSNWGSLQDGGTAPSTATTGTGWTVGTTAATAYSNMNYGAVKAASTFGGTVLPGGPATNNVWCSQFPLTGTYPAGNWTFSFSVIGNGATLDGTGNLNLRVNVNATAGTANSTSILATTSTTSATTIRTATAQTVSVTVSMPAFTLNQQYLLIPIAWKITVASTSGSSGVVFVQDGANSIITPTTFVPAPPTGIITSGYGSSTNMGSQANPMYPQGGAVDSYLPPQQWLQAGGPVRQHMSSSGGPALTIGFGAKASITKTGGIVHVGGPPNNAAGTANQQATGIVSPVMLPPVAELPPVQALENGRSLGISGGFGGQVSTGFGQAAQPPAIYSDVMALPPSADLPPPQLLPFGKRGGSGVTAGREAMGGFSSLTLGAGVFQGPAEIVSNVLVPPLVPDLPPSQYLPAGASALSAVVLDNVYLPPLVPEMPAPVQLADGGAYNPTTGGAISGGRGTNLKVLITVANDITQRFFTTTTAATSGRAVAPFLVKFAPADYVDLPPSDHLLAGFGQAAQNAVIYDNIELPPTVEVPPTQSTISGHGQAAQPPKIVIQDLLPPSTDLPPTQFVLRGSGQAAQPPVIITGPPDPRSPWPTTTAELLAGFGQAAQVARIYEADLLPPAAELPPDVRTIRGVVPPVVARVYESPVVPFVPELPPVVRVAVGVPTPAPTAHRVELPDLARLPPAPSVLGGAPLAAPPVVFEVLLPTEAELPPRQEFGVGAIAGPQGPAGSVVYVPYAPEPWGLPPPFYGLFYQPPLPGPVFVFLFTAPSSPVGAMTSASNVVVSMTEATSPVEAMVDATQVVPSMTAASAPEVVVGTGTRAG